MLADCGVHLAEGGVPNFNDDNWKSLCEEAAPFPDLLERVRAAQLRVQAFERELRSRHQPAPSAPKADDWSDPDRYPPHPDFCEYQTGGEKPTPSGSLSPHSAAPEAGSSAEHTQRPKRRSRRGGRKAKRSDKADAINASPSSSSQAGPKLHYQPAQQSADSHRAPQRQSKSTARPSASRTFVPEHSKETIANFSRWMAEDVSARPDKSLGLKPHVHPRHGDGPVNPADYGGLPCMNLNLCPFEHDPHPNKKLCPNKGHCFFREWRIKRQEAAWMKDD